MATLPLLEFPNRAEAACWQLLPQIGPKALQHLLASLQALLAISASGQQDVAAFLKPLVPHVVTMLLMAQAGDQLEYLAGRTGKLPICLTSVDGSFPQSASTRKAVRRWAPSHLLQSCHTHEELG